MKTIKIKNSNKLIVIDKEDYILFNSYVWGITSAGYVFTCKKIKGKTIYLHRLLMNPPDGMVIDHIDGNTLNNQKYNLRICTSTENSRNKKKTLKKITGSKYKGVTFDKTEKRKKCWRASCEMDEKYYYAGRYLTEKEAAIAYNKKATELFGEFAHLNKIED